MLLCIKEPDSVILILNVLEHIFDQNNLGWFMISTEYQPKLKWIQRNENKGQHLRPADRRMRQESLLQGRFLTSWTNNRPSWFRFILLPVWIVGATGGETVAALSGEMREGWGEVRGDATSDPHIYASSVGFFCGGTTGQSSWWGGRRGAGGSGVPP